MTPDWTPSDEMEAIACKAANCDPLGSYASQLVSALIAVRALKDQP